jgi:hypothetical protein
MCVYDALEIKNELQNLTQIEEMLIARALPIMRVYIKPGGQRGYSGHAIVLTCHRISKNLQCLCQDILKT